ncbi:MAG: TIGR03936 family radical SAM-associated protein [bacterium]
MFARIEYKKYGPLIFISHLDLIRTWERIARRARLPVAFTEGFHPKPKFSFIPPLPVGFEGERELLDIKIIETSPDIKDMVNSVTPEGIWVNSVEIIANSDLSKIIIGASYDFKWIGELAEKTLKEKLTTIGLMEWSYSFKNLDKNTGENLLSLDILFSSKEITPKKVVDLIEGLGYIRWVRLSRRALLKRLP